MNAVDERDLHQVIQRINLRNDIDISASIEDTTPYEERALPQAAVREGAALACRNPSRSHGNKYSGRNTIIPCRLPMQCNNVAAGSLITCRFSGPKAER